MGNYSKIRIYFVCLIAENLLCMWSSVIVDVFHKPPGRECQISRTINRTKARKPSPLWIYELIF